MYRARRFPDGWLQARVAADLLVPQPYTHQQIVQANLSGTRGSREDKPRAFWDVLTNTAQLHLSWNASIIQAGQTMVYHSVRQRLLGLLCSRR